MTSPVMSILVLYALSFLSLVSCQSTPNVQIEFSSFTVFGSSSSEARTIKAQFGFEGKGVTLIYPSQQELRNGCNQTELLTLQSFTPSEGQQLGIIFDRGQCSFATKIANGQKFGASVVLVANQESSIFDNETETLLDVCSVNCETAHSSSLQSCEAAKGCSSGYCLPAHLSNDEDSNAFCCVEDDLINMGTGDLKVSVSAVFIGIKDGEKIAALMEENLDVFNPDFFSVEIEMKERFSSYFDPSVAILISIGTISVMCGTYLSSRDDRNEVCFMWGGKPTIITEEEREENLGAPSVQPHDGASEKQARSVGVVEKLESVELTTTQGLSMLIGATVVLVGLFILVKYFPRQIVIGVIVLFSFAAIYATSYFVFRPIIRNVMPKRISMIKIYMPAKSRCLLEEWYTLESLLGFVISISLVCTWFAFRHELESVWFLQDIFSFAMACMFISVLRINSLSTGVYVLVAFCLYDIFMVFITPFFGGGSVMLVVATAGQGEENGGNSGENINASDVDTLVCERTEDEQMPMLFLSPRFDYRGGFSLLGLGDILLPGILVCYILRTDYLRSRVLHYEQMLIKAREGRFGEQDEVKFTVKKFLKAHRYWVAAVITYALALFVTFIANIQGWTINGVQGQPALLYIVPFLLTCFLSLLGRKKIKFLWNANLEELTLREIARDPSEIVRLFGTIIINVKPAEIEEVTPQEKVDPEESEKEPSDKSV